MSGLDRPVWASLTTAHVRLSQGSHLARRYAPDVNLFASARDDSDEALAALTALVPPGAEVLILQVPRIAIPPGFEVVKAAEGVQMVAQRSIDADPEGDELVELGDPDAPEMLALARLTQPGPFLPRTHSMGRFIGVRRQGMLVAMAGERMRWPGHTEVSGVCTHPDFRGHGYARRLSAAVAARIQARGETAFLHAWKSNHAAVALYESLGFELTAEVKVAQLRRSG